MPTPWHINYNIFNSQFKFATSHTKKRQTEQRTHPKKNPNTSLIQSIHIRQHPPLIHNSHIRIRRTFTKRGEEEAPRRRRRKGWTFVWMFSILRRERSRLTLPLARWVAGWVVELERLNIWWGKQCFAWGVSSALRSDIGNRRAVCTSHYDWYGNEL